MRLTPLNVWLLVFFIRILSNIYIQNEICPLLQVKKKAQTLKDMRDYSFLLSDDADFPDAKEEERPARNVSASNSGWSDD